MAKTKADILAARRARKSAYDLNPKVVNAQLMHAPTPHNAVRTDYEKKIMRRRRTGNFRNTKESFCFSKKNIFTTFSLRFQNKIKRSS